MNKTKKKLDPVNILLDLIIIILLFVTLFVGEGYLFYKSRVATMGFTRDEDRMAYDLEVGDYASLVQGKYMNEFNGKLEGSNYHALADYVEAASMYKIYETTGNKESSHEQELAMRALRVDMGVLNIFADNVDEMFEIK